MTNPTNATRYYCNSGKPIYANSYYPDGHDNGLEVDWDWRTWVNPPYSRGQIAIWARKAVLEAQVNHAEILMLVPSDTSTGWFAYLRENSDARCDLSRRVGFLKPDGAGGYEPLPGAKFGSTIFYLGQRRRRFARVFGEIGHVTHGLGPTEPEQIAAPGSAKEAV